jgi:phosphopantetheinyl transferase (holo-ACP synthase)
MSSEIRPIRSVVIAINIAEVERDRESLLITCFQVEEQQELAARHVRSTAGRLALKRAITHLLYDRITLAEKDVLLGRLADGRPILLSLGHPGNGPSPFVPHNLFLSISHTRTTAYGLAVLQEEANDR